MFGFDLNDEIFDDFSIGELKQAFHLMMGIHESASTHAVIMVADPSHECSLDDIDSYDDVIGEAPPITDVEAKIFFAYEESMKANFTLIRKTMRHQGLPVETEADKT